MFRSALALSLSAFPAAALSQPAATCAKLAAAYGIPAPPDSLTEQVALKAVTQALLPINFDLDQVPSLPEGATMPQPEITGTGGCSLPEMAMLTANFAAIETAQPPATPEALAGTWMSDDILLSVAGVTVPGQEMLVIGAPVPPSDTPPNPFAGPLPGSLPVSQYWYQGYGPSRSGVWNEKNEYFGLIVSGYLIQDGKGGYVDDPYQPSLDYADIMIVPERTQDLFLKSRLNIFERGISFALAGDTLVVSYNAPMPSERIWTARTRTYHRVAAGSPDAAMRIVQGLGFPMMPYFGCLTRMISDGDPALPAAMAPMTLAEFDAGQRAFDQWSLDTAAYRAAGREGREDAVLLEKVATGVKTLSDFSTRADAVGEGLKNADLCPEPPRVLGNR